MRQRFFDWLRERRIRALTVATNRAFVAGDKAAARRLGDLLTAECLARSPQQVARMERTLLARMDPHVRALFERSRS